MAATETEQQYEGAILSQLIKNSERLAVLEQNTTQLKTDSVQLKTDMTEVKLRVNEIQATINQVKWFLGAIAIGVLGNIFSQPILSALHLS